MIFRYLILFVILCQSCVKDDSTPVPPIKNTPEIVERAEGVWPISGTAVPDELASAYGPRTRLLSGVYDFHRGLDIDAPIGTPVYAILDGTVVRVETGEIGSVLERLGRFVVVAHDAIPGTSSHQTAYFHLDDFSVEEGDRVKMGDEIGKSGKSGVGINTPHLHFEYHKGQSQGLLNPLRTRNPLRILPYAHQDYTVTSTKSSDKLSIVFVEDAASVDLVNITIIPEGFNQKEIGFETRTGINREDEDTNPFEGVNIIPGPFATGADSYNLTLELDGSWDNLDNITVEVTDARDSVVIKEISF